MTYAITVCATSNYTYAMSAQARRIQACCAHIPTGTIILVGNDRDKFSKLETLYKELMPQWTVKLVILKLKDGFQNYQEEAQLLIGQMRTAAFATARALNVDYCWSLDSDVLPPPNALKCMEWSLGFDDGYYSIATCTYPSQGGGGFLGGRGNPLNQILQDVHEDERILPDDLKTELESTRKLYGEAHDPVTGSQERIDELGKKLSDLDKKVKECPPKGNVWELNAKKWRQRGWIDFAYPALGKGAMAPSDWCGFGCTLMNRKALDHAHFDGYEGKGTEDLYICYTRWHQSGLRINVLLHCLCDHVIRNPGKPGKYVHIQSYHETDGECVNHLRLRRRPFYSMDAGEAFDKENDGRMVPKEEKPK